MRRAPPGISGARPAGPLSLHAEQQSGPQLRAWSIATASRHIPLLHAAHQLPGAAERSSWRQRGRGPLARCAIAAVAWQQHMCMHVGCVWLPTAVHACWACLAAHCCAWPALQGCIVPLVFCTGTLPRCCVHYAPLAGVGPGLPHCSSSYQVRPTSPTSSGGLAACGPDALYAPGSRASVEQGAQAALAGSGPGTVRVRNNVLSNWARQPALASKVGAGCGGCMHALRVQAERRSASSKGCADVSWLRASPVHSGRGGDGAPVGLGQARV